MGRGSLNPLVRSIIFLMALGSGFALTVSGQPRSPLSAPAPALPVRPIAMRTFQRSRRRTKGSVPAVILSRSLPCRISLSTGSIFKKPILPRGGENRWLDLQHSPSRVAIPGLCLFRLCMRELRKIRSGGARRRAQGMRWLIDALQTPRMSGFVAPHFGEPFGANEIHVAVLCTGIFSIWC